MYNANTGIAYEAISGKVFNPNDLITKKEKENDKEKQSLRLGCATILCTSCIIANNPNVPDDYIAKIGKQATLPEIESLVGTIMESYYEWRFHPEILNKNKEEKGETPKN